MLCCSQNGCFSLLCDDVLHSSLGWRRTTLKARVFPITFLILVVNLFLEPIRKSSAKRVKICFLPVNVLSVDTWTKSNPLSACTLCWSPVCPGDLFLRTQLSLFSEFVILQAPASSHCLFSQLFCFWSFIPLFYPFLLPRVYNLTVFIQFEGAISFGWIPFLSMTLMTIATNITFKEKQNHRETLHHSWLYQSRGVTLANHEKKKPEGDSIDHFELQCFISQLRKLRPKE